MRIKFTETRVVDDFRKGQTNEERYIAGKDYDLPEASAYRWIQRGVAVQYQSRAELKKAAAEKKAADEAAAKAAAEAAAAEDAADAGAD